MHSTFRRPSRRPAVAHRARTLSTGLMLGVSLTMACSRTSFAAESHTPVARVDVESLLRSARGVDGAVCALAANTVANTWSWNAGDAPFSPVRADASVTVDDQPSHDDDAPSATWSERDARVLLDRLSAPDACERELAVRLLSRTRGGEEARRYVIDLLSRLSAADASMRVSITLGVGLLGDRRTMPELAPALSRLLNDASLAVRANAAWALGRLRDGRALAPLLQHVKDRDATVRRAVTVSLGQLDSTRSAGTLASMLTSDPDSEVRRVAAWALAQLEHEVRGMDVVTRALQRAVRNDRDARVREMSAWALAELQSDGSVALLGEAVAHDESVAVRATAAWALGNLNVHSAPDGLITSLTSRDVSLRLKASWALSEIGDPRAVPALETALATEDNVDAQRAQLRAILASGARAESIVKKLLTSPLPRVREAAIRALAGSSSVDPWPWPWPRPFP